MRPTPRMVETAQITIGLLDTFGLTEHAEIPPWIERFARSVDGDKSPVTLSKMAAWFDEHNTCSDSQTLLAAALLGGTAGREWVAEFEDELRDPEWTGPLCFEGVMTSDNRIIEPNGLTWRTLPIPLQDQLQSQAGHDGAVVAGPITRIYREPGEDGTFALMGEGLFDSGEDGVAARRRMSEGSKRGVSVDLTEVEVDLPDDPDDLLEILLGGGTLRITSAVIAAATLVSIPAFADARLQIIGDLESVAPEALVASGGRLEGLTLTVVVPIAMAEVPEPVGWAAISHLPEGAQPADDGLLELDDEAQPVRKPWSVSLLDNMVASADGTLPPSHVPPLEYFAVANYSEPTPKTITTDDQGRHRIGGHVALWGSCHIGFAGSCVDVPRGLDYDSFQGAMVESTILTDQGPLKAGPLVLDTVHPSLKLKASDAAAHYHDTGSLVALVRAYEDRFGLQIQGFVLPGIDDDDLVKLGAASISPDWRGRATAAGGRGVVAMLAVPVSGFNTGLVASGGAEDETSPPTTTPDENERLAKALEVLGFDPVPRLPSTEDEALGERRRMAMAAFGGGCDCSGSCCEVTH